MRRRVGGCEKAKCPSIPARGFRSRLGSDARESGRIVAKWGGNERATQSATGRKRARGSPGDMSLSRRHANPECRARISIFSRLIQDI
ncbi:hypothetical protein E4F39_35430 [Burkholderia pseudomallei]|nr:hypothetical protein [Burkholderia pseudomallei]MPT67706.1 hypothetical protein [Burkholderia pseudomallei]MPT79842.1 hypothetical protein [Burkholderia pseudomallei]MPT84216.1 hypothetical protein [Burkholderia pseudomallei]MPT88393.1 hypothetical protein [Burkholderia pseudomallei]